MRFSDYFDETDYCQSHATNFLVQLNNSWVLVLGIFYFSNLLVLSSTLVYFRKMFLWLQGQNKQIKTLYKASATVLTSVNIIALTSDLYIIVSDSRQSVNSDSDLFIITVLIMIPAKVTQALLIVILEIPVACFNTHLLNDANQMNTRCQRFAHAFVFCQII